jgi:hypothetical protein
MIMGLAWIYTERMTQGIEQRQAVLQNHNDKTHHDILE